MEIRRYSAAQFRTPMKRGLNRPFLVMGEAQDGSGRSPLAVKSRAGYGDRPLDLPQLVAYLKKLAASPEDFFGYLTEASRR